LTTVEVGAAPNKPVRFSAPWRFPDVIQQGNACMHHDAPLCPTKTIRRRIASALCGVFCALALSTAANAAADRPGTDAAATLTGSMQINAEKTDLKYAHAFSRASIATDARLIGRSSTDPAFDGRVAVVVLANRKFADADLRALADGRYYGADGVKGVILTVDMADASDWGSEFITEAGPLYLFGHTMIGGGVEVNAGRVRGQIAYRNQDVINTQIYQVSFDVPIAVSAPAVPTPRADDQQKLNEHYRAMLPGRWKIRRWVAIGGGTTSGELIVESRNDGGRFNGVLHLVGASGKIELDEPVEISLDGDRVTMRGHDPSDPRWSPDQLSFRLDGRRLEGGGRDARGALSRVVLRKRR
jgi:hypothetical protein